MTIKCKECGEIPLTYVNIENRDLCIKCAKNLYKQRLKELNEQFAGVI